MIYTAHYRYSGGDRLDITVKGKCPTGRWWAPTWDMVNGFRNNTISEAEYTQQYYDLLNSRWTDPNFVACTIAIVELVKTADVTFVCFCPAGTFCHRLLLVTWLQHNWNVIYGGERNTTIC